MTEPNAPGRDASGRFVKAERPETAPPPAGGMHPVAKLLFGWVENPRTPGILLWAVIAICAGLVLADLFIVRHEYVGFSNATGFYGFWGFGAFAIAVLSGWPLGRLLRRGEDYYGEADTRPEDVDPDAGDAE